MVTLTGSVDTVPLRRDIDKVGANYPGKYIAIDKDALRSGDKRMA